MPLRSVLVACIRHSYRFWPDCLRPLVFVPSRTPRILWTLLLRFRVSIPFAKIPQWSNHPVPDQSPPLRIGLRREWKTRTRQDVHPLLTLAANFSDSKLLHVGG